MAQLIDHTASRNRTGNTSMPEWVKVLQVIYMTAARQDYCRERGPGPDRVQTHAEAVAWAEAHFDRIADSTARRAVTGFRIEFW